MISDECERTPNTLRFVPFVLECPSVAVIVARLFSFSCPRPVDVCNVCRIHTLTLVAFPAAETPAVWIFDHVLFQMIRAPCRLVLHQRFSRLHFNLIEFFIYLFFLFLLSWIWYFSPSSYRSILTKPFALIWRFCAWLTVFNVVFLLRAVRIRPWNYGM